jgi:7-cyano-7-deazaguanine reductase
LPPTIWKAARPAARAIAAPEFTSLCPVTGQPDFAHLVIDYAPDQQIVESKSL